MKTYNNLYSQIIDIKNLVIAFKKAKKGKTKKPYVIEFQRNFHDNILKLHEELKNQTYKPEPLVNFIVRDPKTRKISKSAFRDRVVHHDLIMIIGHIFEKRFIYDSCANRKGKGNLFALNRLDYFVGKVSENGKTKGWFNNNQIKGYCFKADIKHYFEEVNHEILLSIIKRNITDKKVIWLIEEILANLPVEPAGGGANEF
jgi:RNA-directed DNA polymerase